MTTRAPAVLKISVLGNKRQQNALKTKEKSYKLVWKSGANNYTQTQHLEIGDKKKSSLTSSSVSKSQLSLTSSTSSAAQQTWNLSKILHRRTFRLKILHRQFHLISTVLVRKTQKMSENGEIYTAGKNFTLPLAVTGWTNSTSVET